MESSENDAGGSSVNIPQESESAVYESEGSEGAATEENDEYEYVTGLRLDSQLLHAKDEAQLYKYKSTSKRGTKYFECYYAKTLKCPARASLDFGTFANKMDQAHNHGKQTDFIAELRAKTAIKKQCAAQRGIRKNFNEVVMQ